MIDIGELDPNRDVGRWVVFDGTKRGRIKSWNENVVFVVYDDTINPEGDITCHLDLDFITS